MVADAIVRKGFWVDDVEAGATDLARLQGGVNRVEVDDWAAGRVDDVGPMREFCEAGGVERREQVHRLDPTQVLPSRVSEQVPEQVDAPAALAREVDVVDAVCSTNAACSWLTPCNRSIARSA
jgi:hypothetical protein